MTATLGMTEIGYMTRLPEAVRVFLSQYGCSGLNGAAHSQGRKQSACFKHACSFRFADIGRLHGAWRNAARVAFHQHGDGLRERTPSAGRRGFPHKRRSRRSLRAVMIHMPQGTGDLYGRRSECQL